MKFCPNCGAKLAEGVKFCTECGTRLAAPAPAPVYETPAPEPVCEAPISEPVYETPAPEPVCEAPISAPVYETPAPEPVCEAPIPEPVCEAPTSEPVYEPPVRKSYAPPTQASYAPPKKEKPAKATGEKKPINKKLLAIIAGAAALVILLIVLLSSCGGKDQGAESDWGLYEGVSCTFSGMELGAEGEWIELQKKGRATMCLMGEEFSADWTLDGENITIEQSGDQFTGTLKNGTLELDLAGANYIFRKPGAAAPGNGSLTDQGNKKDGPATYKLVGFIAEGEELGADMVEMMGGGYIVFNGDGTGTFALFGDSCAITYDGKNMDAGGEKMAYTLTENGMEFTTADGSVFKLEQTDETPVLPEPGETEPDTAATEGNVQLWAGDYYGYWVVDSVWEGEWMEEGNYWDCCATLELDANGEGTMVIWDEDFDKSMPLSEVDLSASDMNGVGRFCTEGGHFMGVSVGESGWLWYSDDTVYDDMFMICGDYDDGEDAFSYTVYLRPWGTDWSDVDANDEAIPYYHDDWYLPLVESGVTEAPSGCVGE